MTAPTRMNGRSVEHIVRGCAGKMRYPDEITVRAAGMHYITLNQKKDLWCYPCSMCRGWHLTSTNNGHKWHVKAMPSNSSI